MKTITVTQEEFDGKLKDCYNDKAKFESDLKKIMFLYKTLEKNNEKAYERYHKAKLMLSKLTFEKYDTDSILIDGKGVDRFIVYMEYKDGTPLTEDELQLLDYDLHNDLMVAKIAGI